MSKEEKKVNRRDFLFTASYTVGAVGTWRGYLADD